MPMPKGMLCLIWFCLGVIVGGLSQQWWWEQARTPAGQPHSVAPILQHRGKMGLTKWRE